MEVNKDFIDQIRDKQFAKLHEAKRWWKGLTKEERKAALDRWVAENPDDFRAGWGVETVSLTQGTIEEIWQLNNQS